MGKIKLPLGTSLAKRDTRLHLKRLFPFLETPYRTITEKESKSKEVFKELFGDEPFDAEKLRRLFLYQN